MTSSMLGIIRRMAVRARRSSVLELKYPAEFYALCRVWVDLTRSSSYDGPGFYEIHNRKITRRGAR